MSKNTGHEPCFYEKDLSALNLPEALQMTLKFWLIIRSALFKHSYNKNSKNIDQHCDYTPLINRMHIANISSIKPEAYIKTQFFWFPFVSGGGGAIAILLTLPSEWIQWVCIYEGPNILLRSPSRTTNNLPRKFARLSTFRYIWSFMFIWQC